MTLALPTRRDEAWRYADLDAVARVWDALPPAEHIVVPAGQSDSRLVELLPASGIARFEVAVGAGGRFALHGIAAAAGYGRIEVTATLHEGAHFELGGAILGHGGSTNEIVSRVIHAEPGGTSNQVVRSVLGSGATGTVLGRVDVARGAQKTDAEQSVRAMLLDRTATANAVPQLEIYADDVKCAHGATVGELDRNGLFYMAARGLPPEVAKRLMLQAFVADALQGGGEVLESRAQALLEAML